ncbi:MAG TPA: hypothetical protein VF868_00985 [Bacteroidia bacterium]|jgi:hypothetical protein
MKSKKNNDTKDQKQDPQNSAGMKQEEKIDLVPGNSADVTAEDLEALGQEDLSMDMGDDEALNHRIHPVDFTGSDLDVPGSELDDMDEDLGSEDEENNSYSLGGDGNN